MTARKAGLMAGAAGLSASAQLAQRNNDRYYGRRIAAKSRASGIGLSAGAMLGSSATGDLLTRKVMQISKHGGPRDPLALSTFQWQIEQMWPDLNDGQRKQLLGNHTPEDLRVLIDTIKKELTP